MIQKSPTEMQAARVHNERNPILMFPVEVTCEIFAFARLPNSNLDKVEDDYDSDDGNISPKALARRKEKSKFRAEVVVTHVCQRWRSIALDLPKLWTTYYYGHRTRYLGSGCLDTLEIYAKRSTDLPLSFWFDFRGDPGNPDHELLIALSVRYVARWKLFAIYGYDLLPMEPIYDLRNTSAPLLECLTIAPGANEDMMATHVVPRVFKGGVPKLTYLMLDGRAIRCALPPVSNITILRIEKDAWDEDLSDSDEDDPPEKFGQSFFLELLSIPCLTQLSLSGDFIEPFGRAPKIDMPNLERLRVGKFDGLWDLLPSIRAPRLETLIVCKCALRVRGTPIDEEYAFPALRKLYVIGTSFKRPIAHAFTQLTKEATDVVITDCRHSTSLLQMILSGCYASEVWPGMKNLSCNIKGFAKNCDPNTEFAIFRRRPSFTLHLPFALFKGFHREVNEQGQLLPSFVKLRSKWKLDEPFWPKDMELGANCDFGKGDGFSL